MDRTSRDSTDNGWVKLHRKLLDWEWYSDHNTTRLFIHILLKASHKDRKWLGVDVPSGSFISGRKVLASEVGLSEQQIRTSLKKLKSTNEITIKATKSYSIISVNNWGLHQQSNQEDNQRATNEQPTDNQQITTDKNVKNGRKEEGYTQEFERFWSAYPKKTGKGAAFKSFKKAKDKPGIDALIVIINTHKLSDQWKKDSGQYIPNPATWLNQRRWEDEVRQSNNQMRTNKPNPNHIDGTNMTEEELLEAVREAQR
jgi:biotin operon repressor